MNAQDLKNSILQLAVQGKLVEQRAEEGTARELLEQIKLEKDQLIKDKKIKKSKPLLEITEDEIPFEIPESWEWVRLDDVLDIARGASPRPIKYYVTTSENGINWIKIGDTEKGGKYINSTTERITLEGMKKSRFVKKGSFLLSNSMSFGRPYILNIDGCIHDGWLVLNQRVHVFEQDYLYYLLSSKMVYYQFCNKVSGAVVNNLNSDKVRETMVPLPPLEEQHRIVSKIEEILPYIDQYDKAYTKLEAFNKKFPEDMKKSILQMAMQGKLVEQRPEERTADELYEQIVAEKAKLIKEGKIKKEKPLPEITEDEIPFEIPSSWKWVRLSQAGFTQTGNTPSKIHPEYFGSTIPFVGPGDIANGKISFSKGLSEAGRDVARVAYADSILQVCIGGSIGKCAICNQDVTFNQQINTIYPVISLSKYLYYVLDSSYFKEFMRNNAGGTATPIINRSVWDSIVVPLPPLEEQKRIVAKIEELLPYCDRLIK